MPERAQRGRWRCLTVGCNPVLHGQAGEQHTTDTGHRVAKWPVRSAKGKAKARRRNRSGYYDVYNVGEKSRTARETGDDYDGGHIFSSEGLGQWT